MYCDLRSETDPAAIIREPATSLRTLPPAFEVRFPGVFAWSPVSSASVTAAIGADPGAWNVWRNRRLTPAPLPSAWFKPTTGQPLVYRVDAILSWLAARRGEPFDPVHAWRLSLARDLGTEADDPAEVRRFVQMFARAAGPAAGDVTFTSAGFAAYLDSLSR